MREISVATAIYRHSFGAFVYRAFLEMYPTTQFNDNWHIDAVCWLVQELLEGKIEHRLIINLPPRSLKSFIISVCLPAWLLGLDPSCRIVCASYSDELARKFSRDCRALMETAFYKSVFPRARLNPKKTSETEFETTAHGFRYCTSVGGTFTGRGGNVMIIDDPLNANDANSDNARNKANEWFSNTANQRLDQQGVSKVIIVMQRLHAYDLTGYLSDMGWPKLVLPAIATETTKNQIGPELFHTREAGDVLQPKRDRIDSLEEIRAKHGSHMFAAQFQQDPTPPEGNLIKPSWIKRYDSILPKDKFQRIVVTCDPAGKNGKQNDYTAIVVAGILDKALYILEVRRGHWSVREMHGQIIEAAVQFGANFVIVEDTSSGSGLIQMLEESTRLNISGKHPTDNKQVRLLRHQARFENQRVVLPSVAPWVADFEKELYAFPYGRYDDQVDALLLALEWLADIENHLGYEGPFILPDLRRDPEDCWPTFECRESML